MSMVKKIFQSKNHYDNQIPARCKQTHAGTKLRSYFTSLLLKVEVEVYKFKI